MTSLRILQSKLDERVTSHRGQYDERTYLWIVVNTGKAACESAGQISWMPCGGKQPL